MVVVVIVMKKKYGEEKTENYKRYEDTTTGIKNSQTLLNNYINGSGMVISPVIQIFETKKSLHILQWCELNYKYPENFSRQKMMLKRNSINIL